MRLAGKKPVAPAEDECFPGKEKFAAIRGSSLLYWPSAGWALPKDLWADGQS